MCPGSYYREEGAKEEGAGGSERTIFLYSGVVKVEVVVGVNLLQFAGSWCLELYRGAHASLGLYLHTSFLLEPL